MIKLSNSFKEGMYFTNRYKKNINYTTFNESPMCKAWADTRKQLNKAFKSLFKEEGINNEINKF